MKRLAPEKIDSQAYRQLWRIVDGAVRDAFAHHPEYLGTVRERTVRNSIVKRVTGAVLGYAEQTAEGRSGVRPAVERGQPRGRAVLAWLVSGLRRWRPIRRQDGEAANLPVERAEKRIASWGVLSQ